MLKIGVVGAGHLGSIHIKLLKEIEEFELAGFYDADEEHSANISKKYKVDSFKSIEDLLDNVDAVDIVTPTLSHFEIAQQAVKLGKHLFIEKPLTNTVDEAEKLMKLVDEAGIKAQVGHVERFNAAFLAAREYGLNPRFIESHRLSPFNARGTDVSVVLDLMIHDIDIILSLIDSPVKNVNASGVDILSENPDITSARIEFTNGTVANLTASRLSLKKERKMRIFQKYAYITIDFANKELKIFNIKDRKDAAKDELKIELDAIEGKEPKVITFESPKLEEINSIKEELRSFADSILHNKETAVSIEDGYQALKLAYQILEQVKRSANLA